MTKAINLKSGRYITQMSPRKDCKLQIYDCETGVVLGHFVDSREAEDIKELLNAGTNQSNASNSGTDRAGYVQED